MPLAGVASAVIAVVVVLNANKRDTRKDREDDAKTASVQETSKSTSKQDAPADWIDVGGIKRPPSDVKVASSETGSRRKSIDRPIPLKKEGFPSPVPALTNAQTALVSQALKDGKHPERYSPFIVPRSFDKESFDKDPAGYSKQYAEGIEPGRVFASAQPTEGTKAIRSVGERFHRVKQGETVRLVVEAAPHAPVTFTSQRLGTFPNSLTSITVVADEQGKATTNFTASAGTKDKVDVLAASPITSGQVDFVVMVRLGS